MKKIVKLGKDEVMQMVDRIISESTKKPIINTTNKKPQPLVKENQKPKPSRTIRLTESEMIEFLDKLATKTQNSKRRRGLR